MEENKKKVTTKKENETTTKKTTTKKTATKSTNKKTTKKPSKSKGKTAESKVIKETKKEVEKPEKSVEKSPKKEKETLEKNETKDLEKTIIFDGRESKNISDVVNKLEEDKVVLEDKIVERSKTKKIIIIVLIIFIIAVIVATGIYVGSYIIKESQNNQTLDSNVYKKVSERYSSSKEVENEEEKTPVKNDNEYENIETISLYSFEEKVLAREDMAVLVASETCYASISFEPTLDEVFKSENKKIYKINISELTSVEETRFRTYYAFKSTPTIFTIKAGIVTSDHVGTMSKEDLISWVKENVQ